jgi:hypothetical protein
MRAPFHTPTTVIVGVLCLQTYAAFVDASRALWPFTDYPMYSTAHYEGEVVRRRSIEAVCADGRTILLTPKHFGVAYYRFTREPLVAILTSSIGGLEPFLFAIRENVPCSVASVRAFDYRHDLRAVGIHRQRTLRGEVRIPSDLAQR